MRRTARFEPASRRASDRSRFRLPAALTGVDLRFAAFIGFLALVFLMGGGSRGDIVSLVILRPACALFAAYALTVAAPGDIARMRTPLLFLAALAAWMAVQLIPLPPGLWSALPGRAQIAEMDRLIGLDGIWRPISLSPAKTINSLASLVVPAAGLLLYAVQSGDDRRRTLTVLVAVGAASALLGFGQLAGNGGGPLYFYRFTNYGDAVGLFANRNHNAVFLATIVVVAAFLFGEMRRLRGASTSAQPLLLGGACLMVLVTMLVNGSRAGLVIGVLAFGLALALYGWAAQSARGDARPHPAQAWLRFLPPAAILVAAAAAVLLFSQSSSFGRLISLSVTDELRVRVFPQILAMAETHWLFGTGFGSFEHVYRQYEASEWLQETYLNNAHNDWLQWAIEGGLPAMLIAGGFLLWLARAALGAWSRRAAAPAHARLVATALGVLLLLLLASALDYPLRVPSLMLYAVLMVAIVADPPTLAQPRPRGPGSGGKRGGK